MGDLLSPAPSILFSSLFFALRRRNDACANMPGKQASKQPFKLQANMSHSSAQNSGLKYGRGYMCCKIHHLKKNHNSPIHLAPKFFSFYLRATLNLFELTSEGEGDCRHKDHDAPQQRDQDVTGHHEEEHKRCGVLPLKVVDRGPVLPGPHRAQEDGRHHRHGCKHPQGVQEPAGQRHGRQLKQSWNARAQTNTHTDRSSGAAQWPLCVTTKTCT